MHQAEVEHEIVLPISICDLHNILNAVPVYWAGAAAYLKRVAASSDPKICLAAISYKSPDKASCDSLGFRPPESTVLHMLAHTKPAQPGDWGFYREIWEIVRWCCHCCRWIDIRNGNKKTALHVAAAASNNTAMVALFSCGAGHYRELWLFFQPFLAFYDR